MFFEGKNVAYVGGFGGIGYACCQEFVKKGIRGLVILDLKDQPEKREALHRLNPKLKLHFVPLDLSEGRAAIEKALKKATTHLTSIDILINGAGILNDRKPNLTVAVNLMGPIDTTLAAIPLMSRAAPGGKGGMIVNIASAMGLEPGGFAAVYTATKHGLVGFTRAIADKHYYENTGISYVTICPGFTTTDLTADFVGVDTFEMSRPLSEEANLALSQTTEECATGMMEALEKSQNGSCWIVEFGKPNEVNFHKYWKVQLR